MDLRENKWKYLFIKGTLIQFATQDFFVYIHNTIGGYDFVYWNVWLCENCQR